VRHVDWLFNISKGVGRGGTGLKFVDIVRSSKAAATKVRYWH